VFFKELTETITQIQDATPNSSFLYGQHICDFEHWQTPRSRVAL